MSRSGSGMKLRICTMPASHRGLVRFSDEGYVVPILGKAQTLVVPPLVLARLCPHLGIK